MANASASLRALFVALVLASCKRSPPPSSEQEPVADAASAPLALLEGTFADLLAPSTDKPRRVRADVAMLPATMITTERKGAGAAVKTPYVLAIDKAAPFRKELAEVFELLTALLHDVEAAKKLAEDEAGLRAITSRFEALEKRVLEAKPDMDAAIGVRLEGVDLSRIDGHWDTVLETSGYLTIPNIKVPKLTAFEPLAFGVPGYEAAEKKLKELAADEPPDLEKNLPKLLTPNELMPRELEAYNRIVPLYNREIARRRAYLVDRLPGDVETLRQRARAKAGVEHSLTASTGEGDSLDLAVKTFEKAYGGRPRALWSEAVITPFASRYYAKTDYVVTSYPSAADVVLDGATKCKTPCVLRELEVTATLTMTLRRQGYAPLEVTEKILASPSNVAEKKYVLKKAAVSAPR